MYCKISKIIYIFYIGILNIYYTAAAKMVNKDFEVKRHLKFCQKQAVYKGWGSEVKKIKLVRELWCVQVCRGKSEISPSVSKQKCAESG